MKHLRPLLAALLSASLLFLAFPAWSYSFTILFAFIPLLYATEGMKPFQAYLWAALSGWIATAIGFYWVGEWGAYVLQIPRPWHHAISIGHGFLVCHLFGLQFFFYRWWVSKEQAPPILLFPLITATLFSWYPMIFPWTLGDGAFQLRFLLQPIDYTGAYGLDFIIALINLVLYLSIKHRKTFFKERPIHFGLAVIFLWCVYGVTSQGIWDQRVDQWAQKKIGIVQTNRPASLGRPQPEPGYSRSYPYEFDLTKKLVKQGAEVVIWPEGKFFGYSFWPQVKQAFHQLADEVKRPIIFHDTFLERRLGAKQYYNSSLMINPDSNQAEIYHKMNLVPFGEYTPLIGDSAFFKSILGDFLSNLTAGTQNRNFALDSLRFVPKLCYESQFPTDIARAIGRDGWGKTLLFQSQDGWYGKSNQHQQHLQSSILRAMENRVPMIHVINNGSSAIAGPNGKIYYQAPAFQEANAIGGLPFDPKSGGSFYSENPNLFIGALRFLFVIYFAIALRDALLGVKKETEDDEDW